MKKRHSAIDLTKGPELRVILSFSVPLLIGNLFQQMYNVVDSIVVGNYVGSQALAAVGLCFPIIVTILSLIMGIGTGTSVVVSNYCGAGDQERVERTIKTSYWIVFLGCIPISILGVLGAETILKLIQVPEDILPDAARYLQIYFLASFANLGYGINDGILRGLGDSRSSLRFVMVACFMNVALDLLFVLRFNLAVVGVAVATVTAQTAAWIWSTVYIRRHYLLARGKKGNLRPDSAIAGQICRIGIPAGIQHMFFSFGAIVTQAMINGCGSSFIAGFNAASKIDSFAFLPILSFSTATTSFVGQNLGAKRWDRIRQGAVSALKLALGLDVILVGVILCFGSLLLGLFNQEADVIHAGLGYLYRIMPFYLIYTVISMMYAVLRGLGDSMIPMGIMIVALWLGRVPAAYLLLHYFGENNLFFCYGIGWLIEIGLLGIYYRSGRWKRFLR